MCDLCRKLTWSENSYRDWFLSPCGVIYYLWAHRSDTYTCTYMMYVHVPVLLYTRVVLMRSYEQCQSWSATGDPYRRRRSRQMRKRERELRGRRPSWLTSSICSCKFSPPYQRKVMDNVCPSVGKCMCGRRSCVVLPCISLLGWSVASANYDIGVIQLRSCYAHRPVCKIQCECVSVCIQVVYQRTQSASVNVC